MTLSSGGRRHRRTRGAARRGIRRCARPRWHRLSPGRRCGDSATGGTCDRAAGGGARVDRMLVDDRGGRRCGGAADIRTVRADGRGGAVTVARMLGVDVERLASDTAVLGTAGERLRERWAQVLALRARTQGVGLSEVGEATIRWRSWRACRSGCAPTSTSRRDPGGRGGAWHGVSAVCARLARLADEAADGVAGVFADPRRRRRRRSVRRLRGRAPGGRICPRGPRPDRRSARRTRRRPDADLVLIGGGDPQPGCGRVDPAWPRPSASRQSTPPRPPLP